MTGTAEPTGVTWVPGASGLLGSAVRRELESRGRTVVTSRIPWDDPAAAVDALLAQADALPSGSRIAWCAGAGVVGTSQDKHDAEVAVVEGFLSRWRPAPGAVPEAVFLASSAGGVYAGAESPPFTEKTQPRPLSPYGHAKLRVEEAFTAFAARTGAPLLVGRLANVYGPGQNIAKQQGLISLLCDALVRREEMSIYVSMDTMRDYLFVDDAAAMVCSGLDAVALQGDIHVKVLATGTAMTIAEVLGHLTRIARRRPPVRLGTSETARFQVRDLRLRSEAWPPLEHLARTPVGVGIAACLENAEVSLRLPAHALTDGAP